MVEAKNVIIGVLVVLVAILLIRVDTSSDDQAEAAKDLMANHYAEDDYLYKQKTSKGSCDDDCNDCKESYCKYSDYDCDHDDYDCYFTRKARCDKYDDEDEDGFAIYIVDERDPERYSLEDYKYGYTYRSSEEYLSRRGEKVIIKEADLEKDETSNSDAYYYYKYVPHMREYEQVTCYTSAPEGQLFYEKCPEF